MLQRTLFRHGRVLRSSLAPRSISLSSHLRQTSPFLSPNGSTGQYPPTVICRYFSAGKGSGEEKAGNNVEGSADANETEVPATIEDKLKKELEGKDKEIIDLKV